MRDGTLGYLSVELSTFGRFSPLFFPLPYPTPLTPPRGFRWNSCSRSFASEFSIAEAKRLFRLDMLSYERHGRISITLPVVRFYSTTNPFGIPAALSSGCEKKEDIS